MPVRRLHSLDQAEESVWLDPDDPRLWSAVRMIWELSDRLYTRRFPPGVHKHPTIDDLNRTT